MLKEYQFCYLECYSVHENEMRDSFCLVRAILYLKNSFQIKYFLGERRVRGGVSVTHASCQIHQMRSCESFKFIFYHSCLIFGFFYVCMYSAVACQGVPLIIMISSLWLNAFVFFQYHLVLDSTTSSTTRYLAPPRREVAFPAGFSFAKIL
jgi:hypothetical protein